MKLKIMCAAMLMAASIVCAQPSRDLPIMVGGGGALHPAELSFRIVADTFGSTNHELRVAAPSNMREMEVRERDGVTVVTWRGSETFGRDFEVTATLVRQPDGSLEWSFGYANCT